jgi:hypothetical protein
MDVDERHLPMAFSSEYPPFDPSEKCHLQDSCQLLQPIFDDSNSQVLMKSISLPCGHVYHQYCLQSLEYKCFHCLKYIRIEITNNVNSIISRITDQNFGTEIEEDEAETVDNDEPDELSKQTAFNLEAVNQLKITLENFMKI